MLVSSFTPRSALVPVVTALALCAGGCVGELRRTAADDRVFKPHIEGAVFSSPDAKAPEALVVSYRSRRQFNHLNSTFYLRVPLDAGGVPVPPFDLRGEVAQLTPRLDQHVPSDQRDALYRSIPQNWTSNGLAARHSRGYVSLATTGSSAEHYVRTSWSRPMENSATVLALIPGADTRHRYKGDDGRSISMPEAPAPPGTLFVVVPSELREPPETRKAKQRALALSMPGAVAHDAITAAIHPFWVAGAFAAHVSDRRGGE